MIEAHVALPAGRTNRKSKLRMIVIDGIIFSDEVAETEFVCNLNACKGACCVQGDGGAPLEPEERDLLEQEYDSIKPFLTDDGRTAISRQGKFVLEKNTFKTPLIDDKACAYVRYENGVARCGIEKAFESGATKFRKPVSCHLYPLRVSKNEGFEAVNYERWDICDPACSLGRSLGMPVYRFVREGLIRKYGERLYNKLDELLSGHR